MTETTIKHIMDLFALVPTQCNTIKDCEDVVIKPILLFDLALEHWEDVKLFPYKGKEKEQFRELERAIKLLNHNIFFGLDLEEKTELADEMSDFCDYIQRNAMILDQTFQREMMSRYDTEIRLIITKLYLLSTFFQCIHRYFEFIKKGKKNCIMFDFLDTAVYRIKRLHEMIDARGDKTASLFDPNVNKNIELAVKAFVNKFFDYKL